MSSFAILRTQKLKTNSAIRASLKHAFREQETPNADPDRTAENDHFRANDSEAAMKRVLDRLPDKIRKNGVRVIEYLITASPEVMKAKSREEQDAYLEDSLRWLKKRHGDENLAYAGIHRDESTPHLYAYVVPIDPRGKLNARHFLGGSKHVLSELQTEFAETVGKKHGLERGVKKSKARHTSIREHYANVRRTEAHRDDLINEGAVKAVEILDSALESQKTASEGLQLRFVKAVSTTIKANKGISRATNTQEDELER